jgi:hypothetical protein
VLSVNNTRQPHLTAPAQAQLSGHQRQWPLVATTASLRQGSGRSVFTTATGTNFAPFRRRGVDDVRVARGAAKLDVAAVDRQPW